MGGARMGRGGVLLSLLAALALGGCADELDPTYLVVKERVVGLEVGVVGADDGRTSAMPGETLSLELRYGAPDGVVEPTWVLIACEPAPSSFGVPFCGEGEPLAIDAELDLGEGKRPFEVTIPEDYGSDTVLMIGAVCMNGVVDASLNPSDPEALSRICTDGEGLGQALTYEHPLGVDEDAANRAPAFTGFTLAGESWGEAEGLMPGVTSCEGLDLPELRVDDDEVEIGMAVREGDREAYLQRTPDAPEGEPANEDLQITHLVSAGDMERLFTFIDDEALEDIVEYTPPAADDEDVDVPAEGLVVRFWFVMRDLRGGHDVVMRALCVRP